MKKLRARIRNQIFRFLPLPDYYGKEYKRTFAFLQTTAGWSREQLAAYKLGRLQALVIHAARNVPYYRELFKRERIDPRDVRTLEDFARLPLLTKRILQEHLEQLKADDFVSYGPVRSETSGTTGQVTVFFRDRSQEAFRKAILWRWYHQLGYRYRDPRVRVASPHHFTAHSPLWEWDRIENCLDINSLYLRPNRYGEVIDAIRAFRPKLIWGHPGLLGVLAEYLLSHDLAPIEVPITIPYSEKLYPHLRRIMQAAFPGRLYEYYGNRENTIAAWGTGDERFREFSEYCHLEIEDGARTGDLITTSLHNYAMPLIRYNSEDYCEWLGYADPESNSPMVRLIGGRGKDLVLSRDGLVATYLLTYLETKNFHKLKMQQLEQVSLDEITVRIVPSEDYDRANDEPLLQRYAEEALHSKFRVRLEYAERIPFTERGKFPAVISKLATQHVGEIAGSR